jgi:hypothetical protein
LAQWQVDTSILARWSVIALSAPVPRASTTASSNAGV